MRPHHVPRTQRNDERQPIAWPLHPAARCEPLLLTEARAPDRSTLRVTGSDDAFESVRVPGCLLSSKFKGRTPRADAGRGNARAVATRGRRGRWK